MEYFEVLDAEGNKTGKQKLRSEVHRDGDWHRAVFVWILNSQQELLITRRSPLKDLSPNLWSTAVGGHVAPGDSSLATAVRETQEELGLSLLPEQFTYLHPAKMLQSFKNGSILNNEHTDSYLVELDVAIAELKLQIEEVAEARWIPFPELEIWIKDRPEEFLAHPADYQKLFATLHQRFDIIP